MNMRIVPGMLGSMRTPAISGCCSSASRQGSKSSNTFDAAVDAARAQRLVAAQKARAAHLDRADAEAVHAAQSALRRGRSAARPSSSAHARTHRRASFGDRFMQHLPRQPSSSSRAAPIDVARAHEHARHRRAQLARARRSGMRSSVGLVFDAARLCAAAASAATSSPVTPGNRRFARGIHIRDPDHIGARQRGAEVRRKVTRPRVQVRLEHRDQTRARDTRARAADMVARISVGWCA